MKERYNYELYTFNLRDRCFIESKLPGNEKLSLRKIAVALGRNHSSISREIEVNLDKDFGFYSGLRAHNLAIERRASSVTKVSKIDKIVDKIGNFIFEELQKRVSPEQILPVPDSNATLLL